MTEQEMKITGVERARTAILAIGACLFSFVAGMGLQEVIVEAAALPPRPHETTSASPCGVGSVMGTGAQRR